MRSGCLPMLVIGLILAGLSALVMGQSVVVQQAGSMTDPPVASTPADNANAVDTVSAVGKLMEEMGIPAASLDRYANMFRFNSVRPKATVAGTVLTADGSEVPSNARGLVAAGWDNFGYVQEEAQVRSGTFSVDVVAGTAWVMVQAPGWAPAMAGPLDLSTGQPADDLQIVLSRGISCTLHVTDADGKPISGARVYVPIANGNVGSSIDAATDDSGNVLLEHLPANTFNVQFSASGWFFQSRKLDVDDGQTVEICLAKRPLITGTVVQAEDGKPIAGAEVFVMEQGQDFRHPMQYGQLHADAQTDNEGYFQAVATVSGFAQVLVMAPDKRIKIIKLVDGKPLTFRMAKPLFVRGHFTGDIAKLPRVDKLRSQFTYYNATQVQGFDSSDSAMGSEHVYTSEKDGKYTFELFPVFPGLLLIQAGQVKKTIQLDKPIEDLEINLDEQPVINGLRGFRGDATPAVPTADYLAMLTMPTLALGGQLTAGGGEGAAVGDNSHNRPAAPAAGDPTTRSVIIKLTPPFGAKQVTGFVSARGYDDQTHQFEVKDNQVQFKCPVGRNLNVMFQGMPGAIARDQNFIVVAGKEPLVILVHLNPAGAVRVKVVDEDGQPVITRQLEISGLNSAPVFQLGFQGNLTPRVSPKDPGEFLVLNTPLGLPLTFYVNDGIGAGVCKPVTLTSAEPVQETTIVLKHGADYVVHLLDVDGKPMPGQAVRVWWRLTPGLMTYNAPIRADGHGDLHLDRLDQTAGSGYWLVLENVPGACPAILKIGDETELTIQMEKGLHLRGKVIEAKSHRPVLNVAVHATPEEGSVYTDGRPQPQPVAVTNDNGEFEFDNLPPGTRVLEVNNLQPKPQSRFMGLGEGPFRWPRATGGQEVPVMIEVVGSGNGQLFLYPLGDAPATQPAGSATQPAGAAASQPAGASAK